MFNNFNAPFQKLVDLFHSAYTQSSVLLVESKDVLLLLLPAGLIISLQLLRGDMEQVRRENPLIFSRGVAITRKLGFPDVIMPGESHHLRTMKITSCYCNIHLSVSPVSTGLTASMK